MFNKMIHENFNFELDSLLVGMEIIAILLLVGFLIATWNEPQAPVTRSISTISETDEVNLFWDNQLSSWMSF